MKTKFKDFINESDGGTAMSTLSNTGGMGNIVAPQPSGIPGDVAGSTTGSGDIANNTFKPFFKGDFSRRKRKRKKK
jgi:hypothetical protein